MQNELKITEDALLPIYDKLGEIEDQIKDQNKNPNSQSTDHKK